MIKDLIMYLESLDFKIFTLLYITLSFASIEVLRFILVLHTRHGVENKKIKGE